MNYNYCVTERTAITHSIRGPQEVKMTYWKGKKKKKETLNFSHNSYPIMQVYVNKLPNPKASYINKTVVLNSTALYHTGQLI